MEDGEKVRGGRARGARETREEEDGNCKSAGNGEEERRTRRSLLSGIGCASSVCLLLHAPSSHCAVHLVFALEKKIPWTQSGTYSNPVLVRA